MEAASCFPLACCASAAAMAKGGNPGTGTRPSRRQSSHTLRTGNTSAAFLNIGRDNSGVKQLPDGTRGNLATRGVYGEVEVRSFRLGGVCGGRLRDGGMEGLR